MSRGIVYLLVEESAREMQARVLVAIHAARHGHDVVIGPQWALIEQARRLPAGVMLFKGNNAIQVNAMARARAAGHAVASIEEEILGLIDEGRIVATYDPRVGRHCALILAQGEFQRACLERRDPGLAGKVVVTGNPRLDLLRAPLDASARRAAARIRESRGPFILVNSNYSSINPARGDALTGFQGWVQAGFADRESKADIDYFLSYCDWERENLHALLGFLGAAVEGGLAERIVLRPHPAENTQRWRDGLAGDRRIEIVEDGDHLSWIAASAALVHTSCTTGFEAAMLGTPSLNIVTGDSPWPGYYASRIASTTVPGPGEAVAAAISLLRAADTGLGEDPARAPLPRELEEHFLIDGMSAAARVAEALTELHARSGFHDAPPLELADHALADWQARKFTATAEEVQEMADGFVAALGFDRTIQVEALAASSLLVRSAS
jgi:surface carbohydrate biosynthesis protein